MTNNLLNEDVYLTGLLSLPFVVLSQAYKNKKITSKNEYFRNIKKIVDTKRHIYAHFRLFEDEMIITDNLVDIINLYNIHGLKIENEYSNMKYEKDIINLNNIQGWKIKRNCINFCKKRGLEIKNGIINLINIHGLEMENHIINLCQYYGLKIENEYSNAKDKYFFYIVPGTTFSELTDQDIWYVDNEIKQIIHKIRETWNGQPKEYMEYFEYLLQDWYKFLQVTRPISSSENMEHEKKNLEELKQGIKNYNLYLMYFYSLPLVHWWEERKRPGINEDMCTEIENVLESLRNTCCHANKTYEEDFIIKCLRVVRYFYKLYEIEINEINDILEKAPAERDTRVSEEKPDCFYFHNKVDFHNLDIEKDVQYVDISKHSEELLKTTNLKKFLEYFVSRIPNIYRTLSELV